MNRKKAIGCLALFTALALTTLNPAAAADRKTTNTIIGAGIGAAAGAVLTQGDTLATLGGAAAGGVLGNILTEEPRKRRHSAHRHSGPPRHMGHGYKPRHVHYTSSKHGWKHHPRSNGHRGKHHHKRHR